MSFRLTALEVATVVATVGLGGFLTGVYFNARDTWWKRAQWAMDKASGGDDLEKKVGLATMTELLDSRLATRKDAALLGAAVRAIADAALVEALAELDTDPPAEHHEEHERGRHEQPREEHQGGG